MGLTSSARPKSKLIQVKPIPQINAIGKYFRESTRYLSRSDDEATEQTDQHSESLTNKKNVIECPPRYPSALAPTTRRKDIFYPEKFKLASERVQTVPQSALGDYNALLRHLTEGAKSDIEKLWSIYLWVVSHDFEDPAHGKHNASDTPRGYLRWIYDGMGDAPSFFAILCRRAEFKCIVIDGISKGPDYEVGMSDQEIVKMRDRWNAVYLDKNWRFVHPLWGSKASDKIKNYFFLTEPEEYNTWCRPDDREWQLLTTMVTMSEFSAFPYCTAEFFMMNMKVLAPKTGRVKARNGHTYIEISTTRNVGKTVVVNYSLIGKKLLKPRPAQNGNAGETTHRSVITSRLNEIEAEGEETELVAPTSFPADLENFVFMWRKDAHFMFDIRLPVPGVYIFSVNAGHINPEDYSVSDMVVVTELKLYCFDNVHEEDIDLFPDLPEIGWGVTPHCIVRGIRPITHVDGEVFVLPDADTTIRFELDHEYEFDIDMISANFADDLQKYVSFEVYNNLLTIKVRIPGEGNYGLKIYAKGNNDADFINVCNYFLVFNKVSSNIEKFPKRMMREKLEKAIENSDAHVLKGALDDFVLHNVPDRGEMKKAKDKLKFFEDQKALGDAIKRKNPTYLKKAIGDAKHSKFRSELEEDIKRAEMMLARLNRMEGYLHPIAKLENSTLSEIRSYTWPPDVVRNVLTATYVLLGEDYEYLQDWDFIQGLMSKVGRDGLKAKVLKLDLESVPAQQVDLADIIIEPHKLDEAREASTGTAALFQWIRNIVTERKSQMPSSADTSTNSINIPRKLRVKYSQKGEKGKLGRFGSNSQNGSLNGRNENMLGKRNGVQSDTHNVDRKGNSKSFPYDNRVYGVKDNRVLNTQKPVRDTNISSQARISKSEQKLDNIVGMKIINEKSTRSPQSNKSPSQKSTKSFSPLSKNSTPSNRSPASKYISPTQKTPTKQTPSQKSPMDRSPNQKSPAYHSPNKSMTQKSSTKAPLDEKLQNRFEVIKANGSSSPPSIRSDSMPHRSPLQRPSREDVLSPIGLSPINHSDEETYRNFTPISEEK